MAQGIDVFLEFIKAFKKNLISLNCMFTFIGEGRGKKSLQQYVNVNNLDSIVNFVEAKLPHQIPQYLSNSHVALLIIKNNPYLNKVLPAKVPSYVGCKIPILAISIYPLSNFIEEHNYGISTNSYENNQIMLKIEEIIKDYNRIKQAIENSDDLFKREILMKKLLEVIL